MMLITKHDKNDPNESSIGDGDDDDVVDEDDDDC